MMAAQTGRILIVVHVELAAQGDARVANDLEAHRRHIGVSDEEVHANGTGLAWPRRFAWHIP